jgi:hypothetical protein
LYDPAAAFQILGTPRMELFKGMRKGRVGKGKKARRVRPRRDFPMEAKLAPREFPLADPPLRSSFGFRPTVNGKRNNLADSVHRIGYFRGPVELSAK